jgi:hypothetical protein
MLASVFLRLQPPRVREVPVPASPNQKHFRWYADDHAIGVGENPLAAEDANPSVVAGTNYRLRVEVSISGGSMGIAARLEFKEDSGAWTALGASGATNVFYTNSTYFADGDATTGSLLTPTGTYSAGEAKDAGATSSEVALASGYYREWLWNIRFAAAAAGKTYQFRVTNAGVGFQTYSVTPEVQVSGADGVISRRNSCLRTGCRGMV